MMDIIWPVWKVKELVGSMEDIMTNVIDIDGKDYFLVSTIDKYVFYVEESNPKNFMVLKEVISNGEEYIVSLDDDFELNKALSMYYERYGDASL